MRGRRVGEGGYDGEESYGEDYHFWRGSILEGGGLDFCLDIFWCGEFDIGSFSEPLQGHRVAGGFGHGARIPFGFLELGSRTGCS
jgi:hypothetical protein